MEVREMQEQGEERRKAPEEEAATPGRRREPVSGQTPEEPVPDPSGDGEPSDEDQENPLVNDGSFPDSDK